MKNVTYRGKTRYRGKIYAGEHEPIVSHELFRRVQKQLRENRHEKRRNKADWSYGLLEGLLYCASCNASMSHTYTAKGSRRYRYYVCSAAQKRGWDTCPTGSIPAAEIEAFVVGEIAEEGETLSSPNTEWEALSMFSRACALAKRVRRIEYDGRRGDLRIELLSRAHTEST